MVKYILLFFLLISSAFTVFAADISCENQSFKWSKTRPAVNLRHIFCGEIDYRGHVKGFHSAQLLATSTDIKDVYRKKKLHGGIYNARVEFVNGKTKFSTFFPEQCTVAMIVRSVAYAAQNKTKDHPQWGILGPSAPKNKAQDYCLNNRGRPFTIRMGFSRNHRRINTAFPQP